MNTLVILHGWQSSRGKWQKVKELLESPDLRVIVPDLPGFKPENALAKPWTLDNYVNWLKDLAEFRTRRFSRVRNSASSAGEEHIEPFFLLGHSFGGGVAIKFAAKYPEKLKGLILVSAAGIKSETFQKKFWEKAARIAKKIEPKSPPTSACGGGRVSAALRKFFYRFVLRKTDYLQVSGALKETFKNVIDEDLTPLLEKISVPTLIIWGRKDKITPLKDGYLMKQKIPNSRLEILEKISHTPHLENPELLVQKIKSFLRSLTSDF